MTGHGLLPVVLSGLLLTLAGVTVLLVAAHLHATHGDLYAVAVDGGSSHSEFLIYRWAASAAGTTSDVYEVPKLKQHKFACGHTPGISSFATDPAAAGQSLADCLRNASIALPAAVRATTPVLLRATAGMRVLDINNASQAEAVLASSETAIRTAGFAANTSSAAILPGEAEGAFGWATANYIQGSLESAVRLADHSNPGGYLSTASESAGLIGALDLGGASTQITFLPATAMTAPYNLTLFGRNFALYTRSYLCYGANAAQQRAIVTVLQEDNAAVANVSHACLPSGYSQALTASHVALYRRDFCSQDLAIDPAVLEATLHGSSDTIKCEQVVRSLITNGHAPRIGTEQPPLGFQKFLAFSAFWHTIDYQCNVRKAPGCVRTVSGGWLLSPGDLLAASTAVCNEDLATLLARSPGIKAQHAVWFCFMGLYIHELLAGYGVPTDSHQVEFVNTIDGKDVGWTLGYMLNHTTAIPRDDSPRALSAQAFDGAVAAGVLLLFVAVVTVLGLARRRQRRQHGHYEPIQP